MTPPERMLWNRLKVRLPEQPIFRRQQPFGPYVLDFYCASARLAIEVDGWGHNLGDQPARDEQRDGWLADQGIETLRIAASEVLSEPDEVAYLIFLTAVARAPATAVPAVSLPRDAGEERNP